jgi:2-(3-amino-3-carboxypropyl)histidine synthase
MFIDAKWEGEIRVSGKLREYLEKHKPKSIALFSSVQFLELDNFISELENAGISVLRTKAKRAFSSGQILGCDCYSDCFSDNVIDECDLILYVGDGMFHPKALLLAQMRSSRIKPVVIFNPVVDSVEEIDKDNIEKQVLRIKRNLRLFVSANSIGITVSVKPGQQYLKSVGELKEKLESDGKRVFVFLSDSIDSCELENFPFVEAWVNSACPRIGMDDVVNSNKVVVNLREAFSPLEVLEELG